MSIHERHRLSVVVNARGTFTPLGVSRSSAGVAGAVAEALPEFFVMEELRDRVSDAIASATGAQAGTVVHCTSSAITLAVAAAMAGTDPRRIAALPDTRDMHNRVVIPAVHVVDYGQSNLQAIRLAGAHVSLAGDENRCGLDDLDEALDEQEVSCLLLTSSRLTHGEPLDLTAAVRLAHRRGVPAIIDGAGQFPRTADLLATGADLVLISGQKYLASPTAGLVAGSRRMVQAVRAQDRGIGRGMKATKEAVVGVLAALEEWQAMDRAKWEADQATKVTSFVQAAGEIPGITAEVIPDPTSLPLSRALLTVEDAAGLARELEAGTPPIYVMTDRVDEGQLVLELIPLDAGEIATILDRLRVLLDK
ncbi:aromatic amino acid beta-eliminating lyase/threonine aldolase [Kribbella flavida DSM 17836]|uniref:Aromatic amino acid beta-eliminating lyase/threonine aldolase n=1 Tax=Kribbella flavida (strain DSM 17836 / JCM 10339 / NBRC 14399) TaxID=479435 RepID=D2Q1I4_KRIFD|nr:aminotransferase class V-fold PLP-dependent enzyme [Kribbella flavida]ADB30172.1 aromatic amino acid beta-eliminating lyase/threonine aldolase [Kribbella flavida DSM 17836]